MTREAMSGDVAQAVMMVDPASVSRWPSDLLASSLTQMMELLSESEQNVLGIAMLREAATRLRVLHELDCQAEDDPPYGQAQVVVANARGCQPFTVLEDELERARAAVKAASTGPGADMGGATSAAKEST